MPSVILPRRSLWSSYVGHSRGVWNRALKAKATRAYKALTGEDLADVDHAIEHIKADPFHYQDRISGDLRASSTPRPNARSTATAPKT